MIEHKPVLVDKIIKFFENVINEDKEYLIGDFTVGFGGHSKALLERFKNIKIVACDRDKEALEQAKNNLKLYKNRIEFIYGNFGDFDKFINFKIHGAILDLGVNSYQLTSDDRGFSFNSNAKLDMRMNKAQSFSAWDVVNKYSYNQLKQIFIEYGEVKYPEKIVKAIIEARKKKTIDTCKELADLISSVLKRRGKTHPATKFFQAIRIEVNDELIELRRFLDKIFDFLYENSLVAIISFHSLEDRIVKFGFKREGVKILTKKPVVPEFKEIRENPRARSAKLRVALWKPENS